MKRFLSALCVLILPLFLNTCAYAPPAAPPDYLGEMEQAAICGDVEAGHLAEYARNHQIDETGSGEVKISFDDLFLLSRLIQTEAGSRRVSDTQRMCVGEVVLNRVLSPEYPDTLEAVVYQEGQFAATGTLAFKQSVLPSKACVQTAMRLLLGERLLEPQVVIRSDRAQGEVYAKFCRREGFAYVYTYFCASPNAELYSS